MPPLPRPRPAAPLTALALVIAAGALAVPEAGAQLRVLEAPSMRLVYPHPILTYIAPYTARSFQNSLAFYRDKLGWTPGDPVTVFLSDPGDYGNAGVGVNPRNSMSFQVAPTNFAYETAPSNERVYFTMNHEMMHVLALDRPAGRDRFFRGLFGGKVRESSQTPESMVYSYLTVPRRAATRWYHEGIATFMETWMAGGYGRAQGPYDEMVFRSKVMDGTRIYDPLGLEAEGTRVDFQVGVNSYLYGTRFMTWLALTHGPDSLLRWVDRSADSRASWTAQFRQVYGRSLDEGWREWIGFERGFQQANLDSIRRYPVTPFHDLTRTGLGSVSRAFVDSLRRRLYVAVQYPGAYAHIAALPLDGGPAERLQEVRGAALYFVCSLAWDAEGRRLFYTTDNNDWRDLCVLDVDRGESRRLIRDARIGDLVFDRVTRRLYGVRHLNGFSTLVKLEEPWTEWNQVHTFPYGTDLYDLDLSPDGTRLAGSVAEISGRQTLRTWPVERLAEGVAASRTLHDFGNTIPTSFVFTPDGGALVGSSYYTGVSNIWRYDLTADSMDILTNAETGFFRPIPGAGDSLLVFRYSGEGFVPAWIEGRPLTDVSAITFLGAVTAERHPELQTWTVPSPNRINLDSLGVQDRPYPGLSGVRPINIYPIVQGYKDGVALGARGNLQDPLGMHQFELLGSWSLDDGLASDERWHAEARYRGMRWTGHLRANPASFYDLFGRFKVARRGYNAGLEYSRSLLREPPQHLDLRAGADGWTELEFLPYAQNIEVGTGFRRLVTVYADLDYKDTRSSIGAVDAERGWKGSLGSAFNSVRLERSDGSNAWKGFPFVWATADAGTPFLFRNGSLWLRSAGGWSPGERDDPFANFFFGGFRNNGLDYREPKRYREMESFPGAEIDGIAGTNFARAMLDWNLPPLRFRRLGTLSLYGVWARMSLFGSGLVTNLDLPSARQESANAGAQLDVRFQLFTQQPLTLSGGWARAFPEGGRSSDEWMVSLKIL